MKRQLLLAALTLGTGCSGSPASTPAVPAPGGANYLATNIPKGGPVIARFGGDTLTANEITAHLNEKSPFERARFRDPALKKEFVENLVRSDLMAQEAVRRGLDKDPDVVRAAQQVMVRKLIAQEIDENPAKRVVPEAEMRAYYDAHHDDFQRPEMVRLSAILLAAPTAAAAHQRVPEAQKLLAELKDKSGDITAFAQLAKVKSEDPATKSVDGDLHFASADQLSQRYGPEVAKAAAGLTHLNEVSPPVETARGVYLLKLTGKSPGMNQSFEQVKPILQSRLWAEKRAKLYGAFMEELKQKANYAVDEAELAKLEIQATAPTTGPSGSLPPPGATTAQLANPPPRPGTPSFAAPAPAPAAPPTK